MKKYKVIRTTAQYQEYHKILKELDNDPSNLEERRVLTKLILKYRNALLQKYFK